MTTIATDGKSMAGDGARFRNDTAVAFNAAKVTRLRDGSILGCSGATVDCEALRAWLDEGGEGDRPKAESLTALWLRTPADVRHFSERGPHIEVELPAAVGTGSDLALGAMLAGVSPHQAVEIAKSRDVYTGGKITVEHLKG
jgi:ATP-dependent protease HslVU (ClpYQ) peptidase subunit